MIQIEDLCILDDNEYKKEALEAIIKEKDKNNKFIMELKLKIQDKEFYNIFCKKIIGEKESDNSKLRFLSFLNFPDGVYIDIENERIICHIVELKKTPKNKLEIIGKQFMSAKLHLISLFTIMNVDISKVKFNYYVGYVNDEKTPIEIYNEQNPYLRKLVTGTPQEKPSKLAKWRESKITAGIGKYEFEESVKKIKLNLQGNNDGYDMYFEEFNII